MATNIHPLASVSPKATVGENVTVGPYSVIEDDVVIGDNTTVGAHACIFSGSRIGKSNIIHFSATLGNAPQDISYRGEPTLLEVGDNNSFREFCTINRGTIASGTTKIGNNCLFMAYTHVGHDSVIGDNVIMANCVALGGHVHLGTYAFIGGLTPIHQFVHIGDHAMVGGGLRVTKDVPPYVLAGRSPVIYEGLNIVGLRRRNFPKETIETLEQAYKILYFSNLNVSQALTRVNQEVKMIPEVQKVIDFVSSSKRGIIGAWAKK